MFGHRKRLCRLAGFTLASWLFALASGIASACAVPHSTAPAATQGSGAEGAMSAHLHVSPAMAHDPDAPCVPKTPCAKFCADESDGLRSVKHSEGAPAIVLLALPPQVSMQLQLASFPKCRWGTGPTAQASRVPIPIAFLRLTL